MTSDESEDHELAMENKVEFIISFLLLGHIRICLFCF